MLVLHVTAFQAYVALLDNWMIGNEQYDQAKYDQSCLKNGKYTNSFIQP